MITGCIGSSLGSYKVNWFQGKQHFMCMSIIQHNPSSFIYLKAPWFLLFTHLGLYHQKDTEMLHIFYIPDLRRARCLFVHSSAATTAQIPNQAASPEPEYSTGETTKGESRNILAQTYVPGRPCPCLTCSSHNFFTPLLCQVLTVTLSNY